MNDSVRHLAVYLSMEVLLLDQRCWLIDSLSILGVVDYLNDSAFALDTSNRLRWITWCDDRLNTSRVAMATRMEALKDLIWHCIRPKC